MTLIHCILFSHACVYHFPLKIGTINTSNGYILYEKRIKYHKRKQLTMCLLLFSNICFDFVILKLNMSYVFD